MVARHVRGRQDVLPAVRSGNETGGRRAACRPAAGQIRLQPTRPPLAKGGHDQGAAAENPGVLPAALRRAERAEVEESTLNACETYGRSKRHVLGTSENDGGVSQCDTPLVLFETYNICCEVCRFGSR